MAVAPASPAIPAPEEKAPGRYCISLKDVQRNSAEVTSKQVLQRFIRQRLFRTLEISCSHIPPWVEAEAMAMGLSYRVEQPGLSDFRVVLAASGCEL